jgi:hypothetical protein
LKRKFCNLMVGKPDVKPSTPSHTPGVRQGNQRTRLRSEPGLRLVGKTMAIATPRRSTGIASKHHAPIDPRMPVILPA